MKLGECFVPSLDRVNFYNSQLIHILCSHNLGALHDRGTSNSCRSSSSNYGYRDPGGRFRSVMAYNCRSGQCDSVPNRNCVRIQRFSNTKNTYQGRPVGNSRSNNAQQISNVVQAVSRYYNRGGNNNAPNPSPSPPPPPTDTVVIRINVLTDRYPRETSWRLINTCTNQEVASSGNYRLRNRIYSSTYRGPAARYRFIISDTYGDGLGTTGRYQVRRDNQVVASGGSFKKSESKNFGSC